MKIAITSSGEGLQAPVDERFGRAKNFVIVEVNGDEKNVQTVPNTQNRQAAQGAGIQAAETVHRNGAEILLTGHVGPKAFRALDAAKIQIFSGIKGTVDEALDDYIAGRLDQAHGADVEGHW